MGPFLQMAFLAILGGAFFWTPASFSQDYFEPISPQAKKEELAYLSAVSVFSIDDIRSGIGIIWEHGMSSWAYWTIEMEKTYQKESQNLPHY